MMKKFQILPDGDQRSLEAFRELANQKSAVALQYFQNLPSAFFAQHRLSRTENAFARPECVARGPLQPRPQLKQASRSALHFLVFAPRRRSTARADPPGNWLLRRPPPV